MSWLVAPPTEPPVWGLRVNAAHIPTRGGIMATKSKKAKRRIQIRRIKKGKKANRRIRIRRASENSETSRRIRIRGLAVLARMRSRGETLTQAARAEHTTPRVVRKLVGKQLKRTASGRYSPTRGDTLRRDLNVLGFEGYQSVVVRSSKLAHLAADHLVAVGRFLRTGDFEWLKPFVGKRVGGVELLTDPDRLGMLEDADLVKLDGLYRQSSGQGQES